LDEVGGRLISGLKEWIRWVSREGGMDSLEQLATTGGREESEGGKGVLVFKPGFLWLHAKRGGTRKEVKDRWNTLTYIQGARMEVEVGQARPAREIGRMMGDKSCNVEVGREGRETFDRGVSVEGEFAFTKGVSAYCKEAVR